MFCVNRDPTTRELHRFGWAMLIGFGGVGTILWCTPWIKTGDRALLTWTGLGTQVLSIVCWTLGLLLWAAALAPRSVARPVYIAWMTMAVKLGLVVTTVLLTLLFFLLLPLFSLVVRTGDPLRKKLKSEGSYWEPYKPHEATLERMKRPF